MSFDGLDDSSPD